MPNFQRHFCSDISAKCMGYVLSSFAASCFVYKVKRLFKIFFFHIVIKALVGVYECARYCKR